MREMWCPPWTWSTSSSWWSWSRGIKRRCSYNMSYSYTCLHLFLITCIFIKWFISYIWFVLLSPHAGPLPPEPAAEQTYLFRVRWNKERGGEFKGERAAAAPQSSGLCLWSWRSIVSVFLYMCVYFHFKRKCVELCQRLNSVVLCVIISGRRAWKAARVKRAEPETGGAERAIQTGMLHHCRLPSVRIIILMLSEIIDNTFSHKYNNSVKKCDQSFHVLIRRKCHCSTWQVQRKSSCLWPAKKIVRMTHLSMFLQRYFFFSFFCRLLLIFIQGYSVDVKCSTCIERKTLEGTYCAF